MLFFSPFSPSCSTTSLVVNHYALSFFLLHISTMTTSTHTLNHLLYNYPLKIPVTLFYRLRVYHVDIYPPMNIFLLSRFNISTLRYTSCIYSSPPVYRFLSKNKHIKDLKRLPPLAYLSPYCIKTRHVLVTIPSSPSLALYRNNKLLLYFCLNF